MFEHRSFGQHLKLSLSGASHAPAINFQLENFPADFEVDQPALAAFMERRAPGRDLLSTARKEADQIEWLSGLKSGCTDGQVIRGRIVNADIRPSDYGQERTVPRPGHADFGQWLEQGRIPTGGGANSGRLTVAYCAAGGLCRQWLQSRGIRVSATIERIGSATKDFDSVIAEARQAGDSVGGVICGQVTGLKPGWGGAMFAGLESELAAALLAIPGVKGIEFGNGFAAAELRGSQNNDEFVISSDDTPFGSLITVSTASNRHGGILGGRTTGLPLTFRIAFKPTPTVFKVLGSVDLAASAKADCQMKGRHDPCIVRRALPVVEAMTAFALADQILAIESATPRICLTLTGKTLSEDWQQFCSQRPFVDMVELRVDYLPVTERDSILDFIKCLSRPYQVPVIVTFRRKSDGGKFTGPESERFDFFHKLLSRLGTVPPSSLGTVPKILVDFENDFRFPELTQLANLAKVRVVRSIHQFKTEKSTLISGTVPKSEIFKLAVALDKVDEVADFMVAVTQQLRNIPHVVCAMGRVGLPSRVLAARTNSLWTYASVANLSQLGHLTPYELVRDYRFRVQTRDFKLYGVTGWPLKHTRSPELHNAFFANADIEAVMVPVPAESPESMLKFIKTLGLSGMAVTIPHKETIIPYLSEISPTAQAIGAVNTIAVSSGKLLGFNTDAEGFTTALTHFLDKTDLTDCKVAVLGAGGAAKAVIYALKKLGADVEVFHRRPLTDGFEVIVNATPVDPIPEYEFKGNEAVYDLGYEPEITPLLVRAAAAGCKVENGFSMLKAQAALQQQIWARYV